MNPLKRGGIKDAPSFFFVKQAKRNFRMEKPRSGFKKCNFHMEIPFSGFKKRIFHPEIPFSRFRKCNFHMENPFFRFKSPISTRKSHFPASKAAFSMRKPAFHPAKSPHPVNKAQNRTARFYFSTLRRSNEIEGQRRQESHIPDTGFPTGKAGDKNSVV